MELRQLEYVVAVADRGGFTAGAAAARVAQPSLSQSVRSLEAELGVELFHRVGRGVVLSAAGAAFVEAARQVLRDVAGLRASVAAVAEVLAGTLELVALPTLAVDPLAAMIGAFRRTHPGVTVRLWDPGDAAGVVAFVRHGRAELGVADLPVAGDDLAVVALGSQQLLAVCGPQGDEPAAPPEPAALADQADHADHAVLRQTSPPVAPLAELARLPLVAPPEGTSTRRILDAALSAAGLTAAIAVEVDQREAIVPLVLAGAGISFVPEAQAMEAAREGARVMRPDPPMSRTIGIIHRNRALSPAASAFLAVAALSRTGR